MNILNKFINFFATIIASIILLCPYVSCEETDKDKSTLNKNPVIELRNNPPNFKYYPIRSGVNLDSYYYIPSVISHAQKRNEIIKKSFEGISKIIHKLFASCR